VIESVIYQIFQLEMGFWSDDREKGLQYRFDPRFWLKCERLLRSSSKFPELPDASSSPVLGIPMAMYKMMLMIRRLWTMHPRPPDFYKSLSQLEIELESWKQAESLESQNEQSTASSQPPLLAPSNTIVGHATIIMVTCASLLLNQLHSQSSGFPVAPANNKRGRDVEKLMAILRYRKGDQRWASCHVATYPVYVAGYFTRSEEETDLVRGDMQQRFENLHWGQVSRYWEDLETVWRTRTRKIATAH
jgi:hypothetical protein